MAESARVSRGGRWGRWLLVAAAALVGSTLVSSLLLLRCAPEPPAAPAQPVPAAPADTAGMVRTEMRNVDYHVDADIVLRIQYLRGHLVPVRAGEVPVFENGESYRLRIETAEIFVDTLDLSRLINRRVFGYRGAPIRDLALSVDGEELVQRGKLGNVPFVIRSQVSLAADGEVRLHPVDVKVLGIHADGLMRRLGLELDEMLKVQPDRGMRIEGNDFLLDVTAILPPPRVLGRLAAVSLEPGGMRQRFGPRDSLPPRPVFGDTIPAANYLAYRGGSIRFGKLTMRGTDLLIVDADPRDRLDFYLARYHEQLVAGTHRTTPEDGLVVWMPDQNDLGKAP